MIDPAALLALVTAALLALGMAAGAALKGWRGWLELRRLEIAGGRRMEPAAPSAAGRIELADLKERVRKLEAIASGIE
jgi:hypothetical protein